MSTERRCSECNAVVDKDNPWTHAVISGNTTLFFHKNCSPGCCLADDGTLLWNRLHPLRRERVAQYQRRLGALSASERLVAEFGESSSELLDELVHDAKSEEAASINNEGLQSQVDYLLESGYSEQEIREMLKGDAE